MALPTSTESIAPDLNRAQRQAALRVIFFTVFLDILGFGIIIPQLGVYSTQFGASGLVIGLLASSFSAMQFLFSPFWGRLSDRIGRRPVLLWSIFGTGVGYVMFAFANSLPWLFASRILDGITGANISAAQAYLSDITEPEERARVFGMFGAIFGIGFVLGPMIGLAMSSLPSPWGGNFGVGILTACLGFTNWFLALKLLPETLPPQVRAANQQKMAAAKGAGNKWKLIDTQTIRHALHLPGLALLIPIGFLATLAFANLQGTYTPFLIVEYVRPATQQFIKQDTPAAVNRAREYLQSGEPTAVIGGDHGISSPPAGDTTQPFSATMGGDFSLPLPPPEGLSWRRLEQILVQHDAIRLSTTIFALIGVISIIVQGGLIGPLKKWLGEVPLIVTGTLMMAAGLALVPLPSTPFGQYFVMILLAAGNGISTPLLTAMVSEFAPEQERGEVMGIYQSVQSLGRIGGPLMGGLLFEFSHAIPFWAGGAIMMIAFVMAFGLRHLPERLGTSTLAEPSDEPVPEPTMPEATPCDSGAPHPVAGNGARIAKSPASYDAP